MFGGHRHAQHRQRGLGRQHAGQMGGATGTGNDGGQATLARCLGISKHGVGHAVRRNHPRLMADTELLENMHRVLHRVPIRARTHHHGDLDVFHSLGRVDTLRQAA